MSLRKAKQLLQQKKQKNTVQPQIEEDLQQQQIVQPKKTSYFSALVADDSDQPQQKPNKEEVQQETNPQPAKKKKNKNKKKKKKEPVKQQDDAEKIQQVLRQFRLENNLEDNKQKVQDAPWCEILNVNEKKFNYQKQMRKHFRGWQQEVRQEGDPELNKKQQNLQKHLRKLMKKSVLSPGVKEYFPIQEKFEVDVENNLIKFVPTKKYQHYQAQYQALKNSNDINALFHFTQTHPEHVDSLYSVGEFLRLQGNYREADSLIQRVIYIYEMCGGFQLNEFIRKDMNPKQLLYEQYSTSFFMALFKFITILGKKGCFNTALQYNKYLLKLNYTDPTACLLCIDYNAISAKQLDFLIAFVKDYVPYYLNYKSNEELYKQKVQEIKKEQKQPKQVSKKQEKSTKQEQVNRQQSKLQKNLYCLPNFAYSIALAKFMLSNLQKIEKDKNLVIEENNMENLLIFKQQNWQQALNIKKLDNFVEQSPQTLIVRAIMLYPKLILDIAEKNQYSKLFANHPSFQNYQKKTIKQILSHQFWKLAPQSYSYHFLRMQSLNDSQGLDKILEIYIERSKILWRGNDLVLWLKGALGFVLNQLEKTQFNYQLFLQNLCTQGNVDFQIPFLLRKFQNVFKGNFSDRVDRIDLNNIQDNQGMVQQPVRNNINIQNRNPLTLFLQSLLPWVNVPQQQGQADPDMPFIEDDDN